MRVIEATGTVSNEGQLQLDQPLSIKSKRRVRVLLLFAETEEDSFESIDTTNISTQAWLNAVATNPAFAFLHDSEEDIYSLEDGQPVEHER